MKNYRLIELPDCCGVCVYRYVIDFEACYLDQWEPIATEPNGLCNKFERKKELVQIKLSKKEIQTTGRI